MLRAHEETGDVPGVAFQFIRRFLNINLSFPNSLPVEVVLLSRNSPETGLRVFRSIQQHGLDITRAAFMTGRSPYEYIPAFNASIFLTANEGDVTAAMEAGYPAGLVLPSQMSAEEPGRQLRVAFDFDGVMADDEAEAVYQAHDLDAFHAHETDRVAIPHNQGPLADLFRKLAFMRKLEDREIEQNPHYERIVRVSIITARSAPSHERVVTTLKQWGVSVDEVFFLGGIAKANILGVLNPHIYFDDQRAHLTSPTRNIPMVHVPFGVANRAPQGPEKPIETAADTMG
ncbi:MAG: 5'-nucleotidase [Gemmatimonadota bacterium]